MRCAFAAPDYEQVRTRLHRLFWRGFNRRADVSAAPSKLQNKIMHGLRVEEWQ
jgi:hypothetical protein